MESLLRLDESFDVNLLDRVVATFYAGHGPEHATAQKVITQLQEHPDAWQRVDYILENSVNHQTKVWVLDYYAPQLDSTPLVHCVAGSGAAGGDALECIAPRTMRR